MRFEEGMRILEEKVKRLEGGDLPLEEALQAFSKGMELAKQLNKTLDEAEQKINILIANGDKLQKQPIKESEQKAE